MIIITNKAKNLFFIKFFIINIYSIINFVIMNIFNKNNNKIFNNI